MGKGANQKIDVNTETDTDGLGVTACDDLPKRMALNIKQSYNKRLVTPYIQAERMYFILFYKNEIPGPFYVEDAPYAGNPLLFIGEIKRTEDDLVVGNIFYTQANHKCNGSSLLVYSGVFKHQVNRQIPKDLNMTLWAKTPYMHIFHEKNKATLVISPMLKSTIKENLEI
jgi:hypothetical protein